MKYRFKPNFSNKHQSKDYRFYNDKVWLGIFSLVILMSATFSTFFFNTVSAKNETKEVIVIDDPVTGCPDTHTALGGIISSNPTASVINSRVVVFARGTDGAIYYQISAGAPFSGWNSLGGGTTAAPMSKVVGTTLYVEVIGTDGNQYIKSTIDGFTYSEWTQGTVGATTNPSAILGTVTYNFVRGASGTQPNLCVLLTGGATPTPTPTPTATPTGTVNAVTGCPAGYNALGATVASTPTAGVIGGRVVVFVRGTDGGIYFQYSSGGNFSGWNSLGGNTNSAPLSTVIGSTLYVEIIGTDGNRYFKSSPDGLGFTSWTQGTVNATTTTSVALGNASYTFASGLSGTQPNLCALISTTSTPTPTPTITPTPTPTGTPSSTTGCPAGYTAIGGVVSSAPTAGVINGRVVVFAKGTDGAIYFQHTRDFPFSGWNSLGGGAIGGPASTIIGSTLYVEVTGTDGNKYYRSTTDGLSFSDWTQGTVNATVNSSVILGSTMYSFVSGLTGSQPNLCTILTTNVTPTPTPTPTATPTPGVTPDPVTGCPVGYTALGGTVTSAPSAGVINNRVVVFAKGTDNAIYFQYSSGGSFSGWNSLGGGTTAAPMTIVIGSALYVEVIGTDGNRYYKSTADGVSYSGWTQGTVGATTVNSAVLGNAAYTFVSGLSGSQPNLCSFQTLGATPTPTPTPTATPNTSTGCTADFISLGGVITSDPTVSIFNSRIYVFARGTDGAIYYQTSTGSTFSGWNALGGGTNANPMSTANATNIYVEVVGTDNNNYYKTSTNGTTFTEWTKGTVGATTNSVVVFGGKTYTFVKGSNNTPHLCVKIQ